MSINSEFYKTIGELANQVQTYSDTEKALAGQIYELRTERRRTIEAVERLEEEIRKLIIGHGQRLTVSEPVEPAKAPTESRQMPLKRLPNHCRRLEAAIRRWDDPVLLEVDEPEQALPIRVRRPRITREQG